MLWRCRVRCATLVVENISPNPILLCSPIVHQLTAWIFLSLSVLLNYIDIAISSCCNQRSQFFIMRSAYNTSLGRTKDQKAGYKMEPHRIPKDHLFHTSVRWNDTVKARWKTGQSKDRTASTNHTRQTKLGKQIPMLKSSTSYRSKNWIEAPII